MDIVLYLLLNYLTLNRSSHSSITTLEKNLMLRAEAKLHKLKETEISLRDIKLKNFSFNIFVLLSINGERMLFKLITD